MATTSVAKDVTQVPLTKLAKLKKEVKDFVEYKLSAYKVANPSHIKSRYYKRSAIPAHFSLLLNL